MSLACVRNGGGFPRGGGFARQLRLGRGGFDGGGNIVRGRRAAPRPTFRHPLTANVVRGRRSFRARR